MKCKEQTWLKRFPNQNVDVLYYHGKYLYFGFIKKTLITIVDVKYGLLRLFSICLCNWFAMAVLPFLHEYPYISLNISLISLTTQMAEVSLAPAATRPSIYDTVVRSPDDQELERAHIRALSVFILVILCFLVSTCSYIMYYLSELGRHPGIQFNTDENPQQRKINHGPNLNKIEQFKDWQRMFESNT